MGTKYFHFLVMLVVVTGVCVLPTLTKVEPHQGRASSFPSHTSTTVGLGADALLPSRRPSMVYGCMTSPPQKCPSPCCVRDVVRVL